MTKLHEVVRGVEEKEENLNCGSTVKVTDYQARGHNILASAEVVVQKSSLVDIINAEYFKAKDGFIESGVLAQAIATAIESGAVISIKNEG